MITATAEAGCALAKHYAEKSKATPRAVGQRGTKQLHEVNKSLKLGQMASSGDWTESEEEGDDSYGSCGQSVESYGSADSDGEFAKQLRAAPGQPSMAAKACDARRQ
jgi:hypothetical protein